MRGVKAFYVKFIEMKQIVLYFDRIVFIVGCIT